MQRGPDFTGRKLTTLREVILRHGLPGLVLALISVLLGLLVPDFGEVLHEAIYKLTQAPTTYLAFAFLIFVALILYSLVRGRTISASQVGWTLYLGALSLWEELVFRVAIPYYLESVGFALGYGIVVSNLAFGLIHYFTLRWRWQWCLGAFLGGLALSRQMEVHFDLLLITAFHWIGTFINTPRPPGFRKERSRY